MAVRPGTLLYWLNGAFLEFLACRAGRGRAGRACRWSARPAQRAAAGGSVCYFGAWLQRRIKWPRKAPCGLALGATVTACRRAQGLRARRRKRARCSSSAWHGMAPASCFFSLPALLPPSAAPDAHLIAIVEDGHGVALASQRPGEVQADERVPPALGVDDQHLLRPDRHGQLADGRPAGEGPLRAECGGHLVPRALLLLRRGRMVRTLRLSCSQMNKRCPFSSAIFLSRLAFVRLSSPRGHGGRRIVHVTPNAHARSCPRSARRSQRVPCVPHIEVYRAH
jgi:hypothetical protein